MCDQPCMGGGWQAIRDPLGRYAGFQSGAFPLLRCRCRGCQRRVTAPPWIMQQKWKPGDLVVVTTVNRGLPLRPPRKGRKRKDAVESWDGEIAGPSLVGPGWWNVRRLTAKGRVGGGVYAVPDGEIRPRKR